MKTLQSKKTKIIATIGPATESESVFTSLVDTGLNVARLNMSHGDHKEHKARVTTIRKVAKKTGKRIAILMDLSGPKIRIGDFTTERVTLVEGQSFILSTVACEGTDKKVFVNYPTLAKELQIGSIVMLDDGKKKLVVTKIAGTEIHTKVLVGGDTKGRRGVNLPGAYLAISAITKKDKNDFAFGVAEEVDFFALSFVRSAKDIKELRTMLARAKSKAHIVAKIETLEAIECIDEIIAAADAVMVARGDLAIEIGPQRVPGVQKNIIAKCNALGKPVIVATQMLESMISAPVPTRAEVSDVANAIYDGADAVMLSEETTLGKYPREAVEVMKGIALEVEQSQTTHRRRIVHHDDVVDAVSSSVVHNAEDVEAKVIVALTTSGFTARMLSRYKPQQTILAFSTDLVVCNQLSLNYGTVALPVKQFTSLSSALDYIKKTLVRGQYAQVGDRVVIAGGMPFGTVGGTNMMIVLTI
jgi:pyruvate kinase